LVYTLELALAHTPPDTPIFVSIVLYLVSEKMLCQTPLLFDEASANLK
jgi:hypothetical protein